MVDEDEKVAERAEIEDRRIARNFKDLVNMAGWKDYINLLERLMEDKGRDVLKPVENFLLMPASEYKKGTLNGLQLAYDIVPTTIQAVGMTTELKAPASDDNSDEED